MDKAECRIAEMGTLWLVLVPDCKSSLNAFVSPAGGLEVFFALVFLAEHNRSNLGRELLPVAEN